MAEHGTGLYLVGQLAELGWHDDPQGRTVHAILSLPVRQACYESGQHPRARLALAQPA